MRITKKPVGVLLAAVLTAGAALTGSQLYAASPSDAQDGATGATGDGGKTVTLLTGDRVHLDNRGNIARVRMAEGREHLRTSVSRADGRTLVVPEDARRLLAQGDLDTRLFDVAGLVEAGLDDAGEDKLPLIVSYGGARTADAKSRLSDADVSLKRSLPTLDADAVRVQRSGTSDVWDALTSPQRDTGTATTASGVERVWLDGQREVNLDRSTQQIGAPAAWDKGFEGEGVKVAVLDTGVDASHPDLADKVVESENFTDTEDDTDHHGHGTHVASTIAGTGEHADGRFRGVAPGSSILSAKVLDDNGFGDESGIIAGMEWAAERGAKVANLSLGGDDTPGEDPLEQAVDALSKDSGTLFVIAAGNSGPEAKTVGSPGSATSALTVGAVDREGGIADFSSTGPTADGALKPDLTAPGVDIAAAQADGTQMGDPAADGYVTASGTSMAAPHVAGAAALLAEQHPKWSGAHLKQALASSAKPTEGLTPTQQGTGQVDLSRAVEQNVLSVQTSLSFGTQAWPHDDDKEVTKTVTYRNLGDQAVTLDLAAETTGPEGTAAPQGMFTLAEEELTVPANGEAEVALTADTRVGDTDGHFGGHVLATTGTDSTQDQTVRTAFGVEREAESYELTLTTVDGEGAPAAANLELYGLDVDHWEMLATTPEKNSVTLRLPKGSYTVNSMIDNGEGEGEGEDVPNDTAMMVSPRLTLSKDTTVAYDAREAKPIDITVPKEAEVRDGTINYVANDGNGGGLDSSFLFRSLEGLTIGQVGESVPADLFDSSVSGLWTKGTDHYNLLYTRDGAFFNGFEHTVEPSELAEIDLRVGTSSQEEKYGRVLTFWMRDGGGTGITSPAFELPGATTQYVTQAEGYAWQFDVEQTSEPSVMADPEISLVGEEPRSYEPGEKYRATYNVGVVSPRITPDASAARIDNEVYFCVPVFADGAGHGGSSETTTARSRLTSASGTHFDEKSAPCAMAEIPAEEAEYRLSTTAKRDTGIARTSTHTYARWTFTSGTPTDEEGTELPLSSVGFAPKLDLRSSTAERGAFSVPLVVDGHAADKGHEPLKVHVSYDGGEEWQNATVTKDAQGQHAAQLTHPEEADSVSLRVALTDKEGNTFLSTTRNAYLLR